MLADKLKRYNAAQLAVIVSDLLMMIQDDSEATVSEKITRELGDNVLTDALLEERASRMGV